VIVEHDAGEIVRERGASKLAGGLTRSSSTAISLGTGSSLKASVLPSHGSSSWEESARLSGRTRATPCWRERKPATSATSLWTSPLSRPLISTWTVTSLAMSRSHWLADWLIM
jgi:hypothetical protein